jgi:hypothetical protein
MPTAWETFPVEVRGGLVTNLAPLQQGIVAPGSARTLINFEPSIEGGYRRIEGYSKFDIDSIPPYGEPLVQGSGQTGTTLVLANILTTPKVGDTFTISGVTGTYTIASGGVSFNSSTKNATLTLTPALASSPADKASVVFANNSDLVNGVIYYKQKAVVYRGSDLWESDGNGWVKISVPSHGIPLVNGTGQTGTTLAIDGLTSAPQMGDTFSIAGVQKVYTVLANATVTAGATTLSISPALASSPANNGVITFLSSDRSLGGKLRFARYNFTGDSIIMGVDGVNAPFKYDGLTFTPLYSAPPEVVGASHVVEFKNQIFFAKDNTLVFTAPYADTEFSVANGSGVITLPHRITGLIVFREQLIVLSTNTLHRLVGNTVVDFQLQPISQDIGCVQEDSVQEVGGDIAFLGPDGVRLLSATDRIGDFGLAVASRPIQSETKNLVTRNTKFNSCVIRGKSQYRLFGYSDNKTQGTSEGILATQFADQTSQGMAWAELRGIMVHVVDSIYSAADQGEMILFANRDGYTYRMESGSSFDGETIRANYYTPFYSITDPKLRKTFYRLTTYLDPRGSVAGLVTPKLDLDEPRIIQPGTSSITNNIGTASLYGTAIYGTSTYGGKLQSLFTSQLIGSGFTISLQYIFDGTDPAFSFDSITIEYLNNDKQ